MTGDDDIQAEIQLTLKSRGSATAAASGRARRGERAGPATAERYGHGPTWSTTLRSGISMQSAGGGEVSMWRIPTTSVINALLVSATAGNPDGGTIYVFGR